MRQRTSFVSAALFAATAMATAAGVPAFEIDKSWPKVPAKYKLGDASSIAVDAQDRIWVLHRPRTLPKEEAALAAPPIMIFDAAGNFIRGWGGAGTGYEWPEREHGIHIDSKGFVWVGGNNCAGRNLPGLKNVSDDQVLKFTQAGKFVMQIGHSSQSKGAADTMNFQQPADAVYYAKTNELFVADGYGNHRVIVVDATTGAFKRMWGAFGSKPVDNYACPPSTENNVYEGQGPEQFTTVHAIRVSNDGMVYVADRENRRVQQFTIDGKFVKQLIRREAPFARDLAFSPDQQFLYVGGGSDVVVVNPKTMEIVTTIAQPGMVGGGHQMLADSKGNLYIAATTRGLQKLVFMGLK